MLKSGTVFVTDDYTFLIFFTQTNFSLYPNVGMIRCAEVPAHLRKLSQLVLDWTYQLMVVPLTILDSYANF